MSQFERNIKYLVKHRIIYRNNPVNDKPTEEHSWGWYFEDGTRINLATNPTLDVDSTGTDNDDVPDSSNVCVTTVNANQVGNDHDGIGNICDSTPTGVNISVFSIGDRIEVGANTLE